MKSMSIRLGLVALFISALAGCGGGGDSTPVAATPTCTAPQVLNAAGTACVTPTPTTPTAPSLGSPVLDVTTLTATQWADLAPQPVINSVTIGSDGKPVVKFTVTNKGVPVSGFGKWASQAANAVVPTYANLAFTIAKLMPRTNDRPSTWVNYIVTGAPTKCLTAAGCTVTGYGTYPLNATIPGAPGRPATESNGALVDNLDGTYQYTFFRSVTTMKSEIAGLAASAVAATANNNVAGLKNDVADLGDLTYDPNLTHRVGVVVTGAAYGTGNNTANATDQGVAYVMLKNTYGDFYNFVPATGTKIASTETDATKQRNVVNVNNCYTCHVKFFNFHGRRETVNGVGQTSPTDIKAGISNQRVSTQMCVMCHTDQRKYGFADATVTATTVAPAGTLSSTNWPAKIDGQAMLNFPRWIHRIHMGENLAKTGYNVENNFTPNETRFPQDLRNCTKCHSNAAQADNYKNVPSRLACGGCHDGINFATGQGIRAADRAADVLAGKSVGTTQSGHGGGSQSDDSICTLCHKPGGVDIEVVHTPVSPIAADWATNTRTNSSLVAGYNATRLPDGALKISFDLNSVTLNASKQPVLKFRFMNNSVTPAAPVVFNAAPATAPTAADIAANNVVELMPNFVGGPNAYIMAALPQDGTATPPDFNANASVYIRNCWNKVLAATTCTMTGPDATGYYTVTLTGVTMPTNATMIYGGIGFNDGTLTTSMPLTQTNVVGYPITTTTNPTTGAVTGWKGGLNVPATMVTTIVSGTLPAGFNTTAATTARRVIVEKARCDNCHNSLGTFTYLTFHGGQRNDPSRCILCHNANLSSNGWQISSMAHVHAIHSANKRKRDGAPNFTWRAIDPGNTGTATEGFFKIGYPGLQRECRQCHLPNTVNFGATVNGLQAPNLAFRTAAAGAVIAGVNKAPYVAVGAYGTAYAASLATGGTVAEATGDTLVNSPVANACFSCHATNAAMTHMRTNGGALYATRDSQTNDSGTGAVGSFAVTKTLVNREACLVCHGAGRVLDVEVIHRYPAGLDNLPVVSN